MNKGQFSLSHSSLSTASAELLYLPHIAAWQVARSPAVQHHIMAALPALQRSSVWKPSQIEALWDSVTRGFPIGAFLLAPFDANRGKQVAKHQQEGIRDPNYHLLDGQQRATAIALGFLNPWTANESVKAVLWVDVDASPKGSDLDFVFRVVTKAHPWGYKRSEPGAPLTVNNIRLAIAAYRKASSPKHDETRPVNFPLTNVWPWDAETPIPLSLLIEELQNNTATEPLHSRILSKMQKLPFWGDGQLPWQKRVFSLLSGSEINTDLAERFKLLTEGLEKALKINGGYGVPVLVLPQMTRSTAGVENQKDPIETLFIRINRSGTPLEGEELIYSILKSSWTDAPQFVEALGHKLAQPSRLVLLCARLVLAAKATDTKRPPAVPDVARFRRLIQGLDETHPSFLADLETFAKKEAVDIFKTARSLLTKDNFALPSVLACELAQKSPDVMFLLLRWIQLMRIAGLDPSQISDNRRRQLLGFVTSMSWFAADRSKALTAVWPELHRRDKANQIELFFSRLTFEKMLCLDSHAGLQMLPLPSPEKLEKVIENCVTSGRGVAGYGGFGDPSHEFWKAWNRWDWMSGRLTSDIKKWFKDKTSNTWGVSNGRDDDALDITAKYQEAWTLFINSLWNHRSILLYAQRSWLEKWFPDYDPSQPDQLEDMNRPWDFDHIHPQRYLKNEKGNSLRNIPQIIWDWHRSIGNFRAWPLEANRADGDTSPAIKLTDLGEDENRYSMKTLEEIRQASFIGDDDWLRWQNSVPMTEDFPKQYLAYPGEYGECRKELILAITTRFVKIYREWYATLKIDTLMGD